VDWESSSTRPHSSWGESHCCPISECFFESIAEARETRYFPPFFFLFSCLFAKQFSGVALASQELERRSSQGQVAVPRNEEYQMYTPNAIEETLNDAQKEYLCLKVFFSCLSFTFFQ